MFPYYLLICFPIMISLLQNREKIRIGGDVRENEPKGALVAFFGIFFLLLICRGVSCGVDLDNYLNYYFVRIRDFDWKEIKAYELETGYVLLNWLIARVTEKQRVFLFVVTVLSVWPIYRFYRREAESPVLTMLLFVCVAPFPIYFSGLRQTIAMALAFPMWYCAKEKKLVRFLLYGLLALQFHRSSFVLLLLYPLYHVKITYKWLLWIIPAIVAVYLFNEKIFVVLVRLFWSEKGGDVENTGATTVLVLLILFVIYAFVIPDERKMNTDMIGWRNILILTVVIQCFAPINSSVMRMNYYFLPFIPALIPKIAGRSKKNYYAVANLSVAVLSVFFAFYFFWNAYNSSDILQIYPYVPFWSE